MDAHLFHPQYGLAVLTLLITPTVAHAMSGMEMPHSGHASMGSSLSKNMGEPINSAESEIEVTYSDRRGTLANHCLRQPNLLQLSAVLSHS